MGILPFHFLDPGHSPCTPFQVLSVVHWIGSREDMTHAVESTRQPSNSLMQTCGQPGSFLDAPSGFEKPG